MALRWGLGRGYVSAIGGLVFFLVMDLRVGHIFPCFPAQRGDSRLFP
jgi:hypothetical protein